ncbi:MAG: hypothetical protein JO076_13680, partial [Verrucomicrobia bacterium]|nr:hypothetical protein [Verrucomicrobiota bacterium]
DLIAVAQCAARVPNQTAPVELEPLRLFGMEQLNGLRHEAHVFGLMWVTALRKYPNDHKEKGHLQTIMAL